MTNRSPPPPEANRSQAESYRSLPQHQQILHLHSPLECRLHRRRWLLLLHLQQESVSPRPQLSILDPAMGPLAGNPCPSPRRSPSPSVSSATRQPALVYRTVLSAWWVSGRRDHSCPLIPE